MWRVVPITLSLGTTLLCLGIAGASFGLFIGGLIFVTILTPTLFFWRESMRDRLSVIGLLAIGTGVAWIPAAFATITLMQLLGCCTILIGYVSALGGIALSLHRIRIPPGVASTITVVIAFAWLTWPIWLSQHVSTQAAGWLVAAHPILSINGVVPQLGVWTHTGVMYQISALGQDVPYTLPTSILTCVLIHGLIGALTLWAAWRWAAGRAALSPVAADLSPAPPVR
jgi:hypothetical protein